MREKEKKKDQEKKYVVYRCKSPRFAKGCTLREGEPVNVEFPAVVESRIADTAPAVHAQQDSTWKDARLEMAR
jgi:hypothetical protein